MSLLDDARRLLGDIVEPHGRDGSGYRYWYCGRNAPFVNGHAPDCPWPRRHRLIEALEAAERVAAHPPLIAAGKIATGEVCAACWATNEHDEDCAWQALVNVLRGEDPA